eukprot:11807962-Ditylum_brightwellii.AAC.1
METHCLFLKYAWVLRLCQLPVHPDIVALNYSPPCPLSLLEVTWTGDCIGVGQLHEKTLLGAHPPAPLNVEHLMEQSQI